MSGLTPEHRAAISRGIRRHHERRREQTHRREPLPLDVRRYEEEGFIRKEHRAIAEFHDQEHLAIRDAIGEAKLTPQRAALLRDHHRLGIVGSLVLGNFLRDPSQADLPSRLATIAATRAKLLQLAGIKREAKSVPDLRDYLSSRNDLSEKVDSHAGQRNSADSPAIPSLLEGASHGHRGTRGDCGVRGGLEFGILAALIRIDRVSPKRV